MLWLHISSLNLIKMASWGVGKVKCPGWTEFKLGGFRNACWNRTSRKIVFLPIPRQSDTSVRPHAKLITGLMIKFRQSRSLHPAMQKLIQLPVGFARPAVNRRGMSLWRGAFTETGRDAAVKKKTGFREA